MGECCDTQNLFAGQDVKVSDYYSSVQPTWCSGCGNFAIWAALKRALTKLKIPPQDVLLAFDIGCNGNMSDKIRGYRVHSLHGRVLPLAAGAKIANPNLKVIAMAGDGATYSEGINHFINSIRNNYSITFLVHDNGTYGLTTGQASATTQQGAPRNSNPEGPTSSTLNPVNLALSLGPSFVARGFSGDIQQLTEVLMEAIMYQDKGFAYVDILQACPTYNHETTHTWYQQKVKKISEYQNYDNTNIKHALHVSSDLEENIATGVLYKNEQLPTFMDRNGHRSQERWVGSTLVDEVKKQDISELIAEFQ